MTLPAMHFGSTKPAKNSTGSKERTLSENIVPILNILVFFRRLSQNRLWKKGKRSAFSTRIATESVFSRRGIPIFDEAGNLSKIITTSHDITELVELQNKLVSMQSALQEMKTNDGIIYDEIIANNPQMYSVVQMAERLALVDTTVLITGESGSGKGVIAKLLHRIGNRRGAPFIKINCGAIPENLLESELFGYERGAFTGSNREGKIGLFEAAQKGTVFLDEISELPLNLQVKILQVIQEKEIQRVGGLESIPVDVRIISASNKDLEKMVKEGRFREDLFYRLNVVPINIPPLRERPEDIIPMIRTFLHQNNQKYNETKLMDAAAMSILLRYSWPGNVRELQNIIERLVITTKDSTIRPENLPSYINTYEGAAETTGISLDGADSLKKRAGRGREKNTDRGTGKTQDHTRNSKGFGDQPAHRRPKARQARYRVRIVQK